MTEMPPTTPLDPPPPPPPPPPRRLTRSTDDRMLAGVAGGLGRHFDLDPLLFRVGFAVLALFGGSGLLLYLVLALLVPSEGSAGTPGTGDRRTRTLLIIAAVVVAIVALPIAIPGALFLSPLIVLAAFIVLVWRAAGGRVDSRAVQASVVVLGMAAAIAVGFGAAAAVAFGAGTAVSVVVLAAGVVLVIAAFVGGARWLIAPALIVAIPVAIVSAADLDLKGGVGEREYGPATVADIRDDYRLGIGELRLDLRDVEFPRGTTTTIRTHVGVGSTQVLLPDDACLESDVHVGVGDVRVLGRQNDGIDVDATRAEDAPVGAPVVRIEAESGLGEVSIHRGDRFFFVGDEEGEECASA